MKKEQLSTNEKIDVHSHFFAPEMFKLCEDVLGAPDKLATFVKVKESKTQMQRLNPGEKIKLMDKFGIKRAFCSFPSVPVYMGEGNEVKRPKERKQISQYLNNYFAKVHKEYPDRLMFFADVPLSVDVKFSCQELRRAIEELGLHGVAISTNIAGKRPSEPEFEDFFAEVEKIGAPIFIHPQNAYGKESLHKYMLTTVLGYPAETSVTAAYMILDGFMEKHSNLKIILTHLGGFIPYLYRRINTYTESANVDPVLSGKINLSKQPSEYLKQFYYDTALGNPEALELCMKVVGVNHILFGTDHPYVENAEVKTIDFIDRVRLTTEERKRIYDLNAMGLFRD